MAVYFSKLIKQFGKSFYIFYLRILSQSLDEILLNSFLILAAIVYHFLIFGQWIGIFHNTLFVALGLEVTILIRAIYWFIRHGRNKKIYGYVRPDKTLEIHIGRAYKFVPTLRNTIRYATRNRLLIEYTSAYLSYGELMDRYGQAVISVKPLGLLARIVNTFLASSFVDDRASYSLAHPLKVVLDPSKFNKK